MQVDDAGVGVERAQPLAERVARLMAELRRAEVCLRFDDVQLARAQQREEVPRVVVVDGQLVRVGQ